MKKIIPFKNPDKMSAKNCENEIGFILCTNIINVSVMNTWQIHSIIPKIYTNYSDIAFYSKRKYMIAYQKVQHGMKISVIFQIKIGINYDLAKYSQEYAQKYINVMFIATVAQAMIQDKITVDVHETMKKYIFAGADIYTENNWAINICKSYKKNNIFNMIFMWKKIKGETLQRLNSHENIKKKICKMSHVSRNFQRNSQRNLPIKKRKSFEWTILTDKDIINVNVENTKNSAEKLSCQDIHILENNILNVPNLSTLSDIPKLPIVEKNTNYSVNLTSLEKSTIVSEHARYCKSCVLRHFLNTFETIKKRDEQAEQTKFYNFCKINNKSLVSIIIHNINNPKKISDIMAINYYPINEIEIALKYIQILKNSGKSVKKIHEIVKEHTDILK